MLARNRCRHGIDASIRGYSGIDIRIGYYLDVDIGISTDTDRCRRLCRPPLNLASVSVSCAAPYARSALWVAVPLLHRRCILHCFIAVSVIVSAAISVVVAAASAIVPVALSSSCRFRFLLLAAVLAAPAAGRPEKLSTNCNRLI